MPPGWVGVRRYPWRPPDCVLNEEAGVGRAVGSASIVQQAFKQRHRLIDAYPMET